jgi:hypothetical protein
MGERRLCKAEVTGSSPVISTAAASIHESERKDRKYDIHSIN